MAATRIWPIKGRLDSVINYVTNPEKTDGSRYTDTELQALTDVIDYAEDGAKTHNKTTEVDIPTMIYWCDDCNVPLIHKATDRNRGICPLCGKETKYLCADLRHVFPEERLLYEILTAKPFQYKDCSVWANNNRYYINGKPKVFSMATHEKKDADKIRQQLEELSGQNDYIEFDKYIDKFWCYTKKVDTMMQNMI